jgi:hypothetical protein
MKNKQLKSPLLLLLCFLPVLSLAQTQIGSDIDGEAAGDVSGWSVSLSADGNVVAIGARLNDGNGDASGHVRVYQYTEGTWSQIGADIDGTAAGDQSGYSVSISADGNVVAVGAPNSDDINDGYVFGRGQVRVYQNNAGVWTQVGANIYGEDNIERFGRSVSLSSDGKVLAVGAPNNSGNGSHAGQVRVYHNNAGVWTQVGADIEGEAARDESGESVALSADGTVVAIGAPGNDGNGSHSGHVRVYQNIGGVWTQVGADIDGEATNDRSGSRVSLSADGSVVAIGAPHNKGNGSDAGHVRVYQNIEGSWTQVGADIDGEAAGDLSGYSVSLSANGTVVAIGAYHNDGNSNRAGHVRVYQNIAAAWTQIGADIDGEADGDRSGTSVSLSADGTVVAIGAPQNDGNGSSAGHVRVYDLSVIVSSDSFVQTNFMVYPNPASNYVTVQLNDGLQLVKVNVYSTLGQLVKTERNAVISVNELAKGSYFIQVITNQGKATKTIVVK